MQIFEPDWRDWQYSPINTMMLNFQKETNKMNYNEIPNSYTLALSSRGFVLRLKIKKVIFSGPCTIVLWANGDKTVVKRAEGDKNDREVAVLYAIAKKKFGNITRVHKKLDPFAKTNAQRIAILRYIVAEEGFDVEKLVKEAQTF